MRRTREEGTAPLFCAHLSQSGMITTQSLNEALERQLAETPHFLVFAEVRPSGKAVVEVDNDRSITLADLTAINKGLREEFGEALDDLELEVSSPGVGRPFRVLRQYEKHIGRDVEVTLVDGDTLQGRLAGVDTTGISLFVERPSKVKGRAPKVDEEATTIPFDRIKNTQATIKFN
jgi:ribosome maturation factor RimP